MIFEQHYLDCLSQASYLIGDESTGRAVVVDPRRDISPYLDAAAEHGLQIETVIETHFHADFLSGHLELQEAVGAEIAYGAEAVTGFVSRKLAHGERLDLGEVVLEARHTPGHTPESISIVIYERAGAEPFGVLTGDTLFIGDVGRPDLLSSVGVTSEDLAGQLYDSLHQQLLTLPDATKVFPGHGAGSACGKNLSTETTSTIGEQRASNYALAPMDRTAFIEIVTAGQSSPPAYFSYDAKLNREPHGLLDESSVPDSLTLEAVKERQAAGAVVLDVRPPDAYASGHLIGSINVGLDGRFSEYSGGVISPEADIVVVAADGRTAEAKNRLARIGFDRVVGALADADRVLAEHGPAVTVSARLSAAELRDRLQSGVPTQLVDVRQPGETANGALEGAILLPLTQLRAQLDQLDAEVSTVVYCAGGYRSSIAASLMKARGFAEVADLEGGYGSWSEAAAPVEA